MKSGILKFITIMDLDKEFYTLRRELIDLQNRERISFVSWLLHLTEIPNPFSEKPLKFPVVFTAFILVYIFITQRLIDKLMGNEPLLSITTNLMLFFMFYDKFVSTPKSEKENNLLEYIKGGIIKLLRKFY